ncbi:MAG: HAD-IIB family hydrolase [Candidatus Pacebacteria bacterium]|nr:HAD-IIB family hydrolase [Candidatus Paceibacterota bacterium]MCF7857028.1 HAD-IIB family hydrolase [Candidatus Paceibacterota bacterium]
MYTHKKHLFFDMDDTISASRTPMEDEILAFYTSLPHDIIIVSGAQVSQIDIQIRNLPAFRLGQNGNQAVDPQNQQLWTELLNEDHTKTILDHVNKIRSKYVAEIRDHEDLVEHRGAQIGYSLIGHNEDLCRKRTCDPDKSVRQSLLRDIPFESDEIEVRIGGTTCFDYFQKGRHKGYNVNRLIEEMGWEKDNCIYFGDALFPGGNDETVIGVIETHPVDDHLHTHSLLKKYFT